MIKCDCGNKDCKGTVSLSATEGTMDVRGGNGEVLIYLSANTAVELIKELKKFLLDLAEVE